MVVQTSSVFKCYLFVSPLATSHEASSTNQPSPATEQKRQKKPKMSDAEVIAHLSKSKGVHTPITLTVYTVPI